MKDTLIVIGAKYVLPDGSLYPITKSRVDVAVDEYSKELTKTVTMTSTVANHMKRYAVGMGVPKDDVLTEAYSTTTLEDLLFTKILIVEPKGFTNLGIVSSYWHRNRLNFLRKMFFPEKIYKTEFIPALDLRSKKEIDKDIKLEKIRLPVEELVYKVPLAKKSLLLSRCLKKLEDSLISPMIGFIN